MNNVKSRTGMRHTDEQLEGCMRIATTGIKPEIRKDTQTKVMSDVSLMTGFVKENY
jgi:hypothetical protein